jgi:nucleotide-binding universal stress UspA family protein
LANNKQQTTNNKQQMKYQKILAAIDRSPMGKIVFEQALEIAKQDGAQLLLFHAIPVENQGITPYSNLYGEELLEFSRFLQEQLDKEKENVRHWLAEYCQIATEQGVATEYDYKIGEAGRWVRELAHSWAADLVVIGRRGLRGLAEMFLGSVSNYIVHHVHCSVLVLQGEKMP